MSAVHERRRFSYYVAVRWIGIAVGWAVAALALIGVVRLPGAYLDLYVKDTYFAISKLWLAAAVALLLVAPLAVATVRAVRACR